MGIGESIMHSFLLHMCLLRRFLLTVFCSQFSAHSFLFCSFCTGTFVYLFATRLFVEHRVLSLLRAAYTHVSGNCGIHLSVVQLLHDYFYHFRIAKTRIANSL